MRGRETETDGGQALLERRARHIVAGRFVDAADVSEVIAGITRLEERLERLETRLAADD